MTSIVLAGGEGTRLGRNKLLEVVGEQPLIHRVIESLDSISDRILVITAQGRTYPAIKATQATVDFASDIYPGKGAMGGIYTGLSASGSEHNLVVAADMPFLNRDLLRYLIDAATGFDIVMPRINGLIHPLHAVYAKNCLPAIRAQIEKGRLQIRVILELVRVRYVEETEIDGFDPEHLSFFNVNTLEDLSKARMIAAGIGGR